MGMPNVLRGMRRTFADVDGLVLTDIWGATEGEDITPYLIDPLHLSDAGADLYAAQVFLALGGVRVGPEPLGLERSFGFAPVE